MAKEYDVKQLKDLVDEGNPEEIAKFMKENDLILNDQTIESIHKKEFHALYDEYYLKQLIKKLALNASYGALINASSVFYDFRLGASTTMSGRKIWQNLSSAANEFLTGTYEPNGVSLTYGDTDSKISTSKQRIKRKNKNITLTIEKLFEDCERKEIDEKTGKEYGYTSDLALSYNPVSKQAVYLPIAYVYRHKVSKGKWIVKDELNNKTIMTEDHSCMIIRDDELISIKPKDMILDDKLITYIENTNEIYIGKIVEVYQDGYFEDEYVYDIGINDEKIHWFFSDDILVHNSCYLSMDTDEFRKKHPEIDYTSKEDLIKLADDMADYINNTYPDYMEKTFHCVGESRDIMKCGREVVASRGLFVSKKRYALMVFDKDGFRMDTHGEGKLKIMGLQVQRSDTPMIVRKLLKKMIESLLTTGNTDNLQKILKDFKQTDWQNLKPWQKGTPKAVNKLTFYTNEYNKTGKCTVGHVMGAINWNNLIAMNNDRKSPKIKDGDKVIVCKMKDGNIYNMKSVAYPIDLNILPKWFKELPFDEQKMSGSVVDKTIESVFGVLGIDLSLDSIQEDMPEEIANFIQTY